MLTVSALVEQVADERDDDDLVLEQLEQPAARSAVGNASCSAASRLAPPT